MSLYVALGFVMYSIPSSAVVAIVCSFVEKASDVIVVGVGWWVRVRRGVWGGILGFCFRLPLWLSVCLSVCLSM